MRSIVLSAVSATVLLVAGAAMPNRAEAMFAGTRAVGLAAESADSLQSVWCGWGCHHFHHRHAFFFRHRHVLFFHRRFHHGFAFAHPCTWC